MATGRPRHDSMESTPTLWEKLYERLPKGQSVAPFALDEEHNSFEETSTGDESEEYETDSDASSTTLTNPPPVISTEPSKPWEYSTQQEHLTIIMNNVKDYDRNKRSLRVDLSRRSLTWQDDEEEERPWRFGLTGIHLEFTAPQWINIPNLISSSRVPFWLKLKTEKRKPPPKDNTRKKTLHHKLTPNLDISLRYGAFADLNQFQYSPKHSWAYETNSIWTLALDDFRSGGYIEWIIENRHAQTARKSQLFVSNIDQTVVVDTRTQGFDIYICQKCNMSEFEADLKSENNRPRKAYNNNRAPQKFAQPKTTFQSFDQRPKKPPPLIRSNTNEMQRTFPAFRTIRADYHRIGQHTGCYFPTIQFSVGISSVPLTNDQQATQDQIKQTLSLLIEFFLAHRITVCYGKIEASPGPRPYLFFQEETPEFPSLITKYSWQMLSVNGYRLQLKINDDFKRALFHIHRTEENPDELFYRVCVYLSRICSLRPFLNIHQELQHAIDESKRKRDHAAYGLVRKLDFEGVNEVYVPSVTITPTTIRIKPLKLCRTNRVLRATREFGKAVEHFVLVDVREENGRDIQSYHFRHLRQQLLDCLRHGFTLMGDDRQYRYLHHSQSQLRERQFWFYYHEPKSRYLSFAEAYRWMGTFDKEKNPAKHTARIALCFSTTTATARVPEQEVLRIDDIKTRDGRLTFTDGCGRMSTELRDKIKKFLHMKRNFSAVQFRYDGAKGVVSVHPDMPPNIHLCIRDSMKKFDSTHDCFEVCKLSAPRPLFLNRQAILLLSFRKVPDASFLILQQQNHLSLISALLQNTDAEKQILLKIPSWFLPRDIHLANIDYIHEPFFRQLLISSCLQSMRDLLQRTRIRIPPNEGRNMIGVVDEYNVLKPDEVYVQYTILSRGARDNNNDNRTKVLEKCPVVITKNPCHHPGDIRTFTAVNYPQLKHLIDVIVFSQQGDRPAPHDISGSDLDGDEYLVVWHDDLVPHTTKNAQPYDFDAHTPPQKPVDSVGRDDINNTILDIAEQDCLGRLSNLHLAFADKFGVDSVEPPKKGVLSTVELAGAISQEVDSGKTGYHPLNEDQIRELNNALGNQRPDFVGNPNYEQYRSEAILGKLYRASKKTIPGWNKLVQYHRHLRHLQVRTRDEPEEEEEEDEGQIEDDSEETAIHIDQSLIDAVDQENRGYKDCAAFAKELAFVYRQEILEILNLYGLSHESDIWCRNSSAGASGELEDTAYAELDKLVSRTRYRFFLHQVLYCDTGRCDEDTLPSDLCNTCRKRQRSIAIACYISCYGAEHASEEAPILSLPWIFASFLVQHRIGQEPPISEGLLSIAMKKTLNHWIGEKRCLILNGTTLQFRKPNSSHRIEATVDLSVCVFIEVLRRFFMQNEDSHWPLILSRFLQQILSDSPIPNQPNISDEWRLALDSHRISEDDRYTAKLSAMVWTDRVDQLMHLYFRSILDICFEEGRHTNNPAFLDISESIILLLQKMAIDETIY